MRTKKIENVNKIAILRANAVGDFILSLPAFEALRRTYPNSEIILLGQPWHREFLANRPSPIDRVEVIPYVHGLNENTSNEMKYCEKTLTSFFAAMQAESFDLAIQLHGGGAYSNPFILQLGAKYTIGPKPQDAVELDCSIPYRLHQHEILRCLEVVALAGANPCQIEPVLSLTFRDYLEMSALIEHTKQNIVVINPGARDPRRRWPAQYFAIVAKALVDQGVLPVINGTKEETPIATIIEKALDGKVLNLCGKLSLGALSALLAKSRLLITNDTGTLHLGLAVGAAAVSIFWCGNMMSYQPSAGRRHIAHIAWRLNCPVCGHHCIYENCDHQVSFVADVTTKEVIDSALELYHQQKLADSFTSFSDIGEGKAQWM